MAFSARCPRDWSVCPYRAHANHRRGPADSRRSANPRRQFKDSRQFHVLGSSPSRFGRRGLVYIFDYRQDRGGDDDGGDGGHQTIFDERGAILVAEEPGKPLHRSMIPRRISRAVNWIQPRSIIIQSTHHRGPRATREFPKGAAEFPLPRANEKSSIVPPHRRCAIKWP